MVQEESVYKKARGETNQEEKSIVHGIRKGTEVPIVKTMLRTELPRLRGYPIQMHKPWVRLCRPSL